MPKHTPGPWRIGKYPSTIISSSRVETTRSTINNDGGVNDVEYYGGSLIAESVLRHENAKLIAAAPAMLEVLAQLVHCNDEYEAIQLEAFEFSELVERLMRKIPHQKVVDLSIKAFRMKPVNDEKITEYLARDILKTVSRRKRLSEKQKKVFN